MAYGAHCQQEDGLDRPVAGHTNICPGAIRNGVSDDFEDGDDDDDDDGPGEGHPQPGVHHQARAPPRLRLLLLPVCLLPGHRRGAEDGEVGGR